MDNKLTVTASDLELTIKTTDTELEIMEPGSCCIPLKKLHEICRLFGDGSMIIVASNDKSVTISDSGSKTQFKLQTLDPKDYPALTSDSYDAQPIETATLLKYLNRVIFASSSDDSRFNLNGIYFGVYKDRPCVVATDGHRLSIQLLDKPIVNGNTILPKKAAEVIIRALSQSKEDMVTIGRTDKQLIVTIGNVDVITRLVEGEYPDVSKVIPEFSNNVANIDKEPFVGAIKRAGLMCSDNKKGLLCKASIDNIHMGTTTDVGTSSENCPISLTGEQWECIMNHRYLLDAVMNCDSMRVLLTWASEGKPVLFQPVGEVDYFNLIMPMRP
jgi:DNA polymerase-3 subunit beta